MGEWGNGLSLLLPEWQGYGLSADVSEGARVLARHWWAGEPHALIDAPDHEVLTCDDGVLGLSSIEARARRTLTLLDRAQPARLVTLGGTCGVELAPIAYLNERYRGDLAVVWLDGHADLNTPQSSPSSHFHGMALRTLLGEGPVPLVELIPRPVRPAQVFLVGTRDLDPAEREFIETSGVTWMPNALFGGPQALTSVLTSRGFGHVYVHFDMDVINPTDFRNALMHTPGGPLLAEVADVLSTLHRLTDVVGFSVLEYCDRDRADRERLLTVLRAVQARSCCS